MLRRLTTTMVALLSSASVAIGGPVSLTCAGFSPDWTLLIDNDTATLTRAKETTFDIPHFTRAQGRDWPLALSLIADFDTAIAVIDKTTCSQNNDGHLYSVDILTQQSGNAILLTGCCDRTL